MTGGPHGERASAGASCTDSVLEGFFERTMASYFRASAGAPSDVLDVRLAGSAVRLRFLCRPLRQALGSAFEHLAAASPHPQPAMDVSLGDSAIGGMSMPAPPWSLDDYTARGDIRGISSQRFRVSFHTHSGIFIMMDLATGRAICWIRDARTVPPYATSMPLLPLLHWWTQELGLQLVHAGAVGVGGAGALLAGSGGAGKSNTALTCLCAGMDYASDDYCAVDPGPTPVAHSVFSTGRLHAADVARIPGAGALARGAVEHPRDKTIFFLNRCVPQRIVTHMPLRVVLLPRIGRGALTTWEPATGAEACRALAAVTLQQLPGAGAHAIDAISRLVRALPCRHLNLGSDRTSVTAAIRAILEEIE